MDLVEATTRDALHETDAVLDHLFEHDNTAPFLAYRFIQRFVGSNPSPRYIKVRIGVNSMCIVKYEH